MASIWQTQRGKLWAHLTSQRHNALIANDHRGAALMALVLKDFTGWANQTETLMKLNLGKILNIAAMVQMFVASAEEKIKGAKKGAEKKAAVVAVLKELLGSAELASGKDLLDDAKFNAALDVLIEAEVAVMNARTAVKDLIDSAKTAKPPVE